MIRKFYLITKNLMNKAKYYYKKIYKNYLKMNKLKFFKISHKIKIPR